MFGNKQDLTNPSKIINAPGCWEEFCIARDNQNIIIPIGSTGLFSGQTLREKAEPITEVNAEAEQQRIDDEAKHEADVRSQEDAGDFGIGRVFANGQLPNQEQEDDEA